MDVEKGRVNGTAKGIDKKKIIYFFRDIKQELKKVEWTSKEELKGYVKIVLISILSFSMLVYGIDLMIQAVLALINKIFG